MLEHEKKEAKEEESGECVRSLKMEEENESPKLLVEYKSVRIEEVENPSVERATRIVEEPQEAKESSGLTDSVIPVESEGSVEPKESDESKEPMELEKKNESVKETKKTKKTKESDESIESNESTDFTEPFQPIQPEESVESVEKSQPVDSETRFQPTTAQLDSPLNSTESAEPSSSQTPATKPSFREIIASYFRYFKSFFHSA